MASLDLPPPSPPAEKAATSSDQTGQSRPGYGAGDKDVSGHRDGEADVPQANLSNRKQPSRLTRGEQHRRDRKPERLRGDQVPIIAAEPPPGQGGIPQGGMEQPAWNPKTGTFFVSIPQLSTGGGSDPGGVAEISTAGNVLRTISLATLAGPRNPASTVRLHRCADHCPAASTSLASVSKSAASVRNAAMIDFMSAEAICSGKLVITGRCLLAFQFTLGPQCKRPDTPLTPRAGTLPRHARVSSVPTYRWLRTKGRCFRFDTDPFSCRNHLTAGSKN
jgi:hypothetical protein